MPKRAKYAIYSTKMIEAFFNHHNYNTFISKREMLQPEHLSFIQHCIYRIKYFV